MSRKNTEEPVVGITPDDVQQLAKAMRVILNQQGHELVEIKDIPHLRRLARRGLLHA